MYDFNTRTPKNPVEEEKQSMESWRDFYAGSNMDKEDVKWRSDLHKSIMDGKVHEKIVQVRNLGKRIRQHRGCIGVVGSGSGAAHLWQLCVQVAF